MTDRVDVLCKQRLPLSAQHRCVHPIDSESPSERQQVAAAVAAAAAAAAAVDDEDDLDDIDYDVSCNDGGIQKTSDLTHVPLVAATAVRSTLLGGRLPSRSDASLTRVNFSGSAENDETPL